MRITQATPEGSSLQALGGPYTLQPVGSEPQRKYRRVFALTLPTGGVADGLRFGASTRLQLSFPTLEFNARAGGAIEAATLSQRGSKLLVELPVARTLQRITSSVANQATIRAFRTDGDVIAEDAFKSVQQAQGSAELGIVDQRVALDHSDGSFLISQVQQLWIRSAAANPKVGLKLPLLGADEFFLSGSDGPLFDDPTLAHTLDASLLRVLQTLAARLDQALSGALLPPTLELQLILESDTPALAQFTLFNLDYSLLRRRFATPASGQALQKKAVLQFDGSALQTRSIMLELPRSASLARADLSLRSSFALSGEASSAASEQASGSTPVPAAAAASSALRLRSGIEVAAAVPLAQALLPEGGTVEILGVRARARLLVRLYADEAGAPGAMLAEATCLIERSGIRHTLRFRFTRTAVVSTRAWLALTVAESEAAWLLAADQTGMTCSRTAGGGWSPSVASRAIASLFGSDGSNAAADTASSFKGVRVRLGGLAVPGQLSGDEQRHSLVAQATPIAQNSPTAVAIVQLDVLSSERGQVTVTAPELEYDVLT